MINVLNFYKKALAGAFKTKVLTFCLFRIKGFIILSFLKEKTKPALNLSDKLALLF